MERVRLGLLRIALVLFTLCTARGASADVPRTAFFYGTPVPPDLFQHYDRVVVEPDNYPSPPALGATRAQAFAYVSIGEIADDHVLHKAAPKACFVARNPGWKADVADLTRIEWHTFVLDRLIEPLWARGYRGFFFDTLDSFELAAKTPAAQKVQTEGLKALLRKVTARHPDAKLILNRGFDAIEAVRPNVVGVAVESLFGGWDEKAKKYVPVSKEDREWLMPRLLDVQKKHKLPVTVIDYVPREKPDERRDVARQIAQLGFDPWVGAPALDDLGVGQTELVPRRILLVYGSAPTLAEEPAHRLAASILERMGYAVDYMNAKTPTVTGRLSTRYAGVVAALSDDDAQRAKSYRDWLLERVREGIPIAILEGIGFSPDVDFLKQLGLEPAGGDKAVKVAISSPWTTYETKNIDLGKPIPMLRTSDARTQSFLRLEDGKGKVGDAVVVGPWGGIALAPYFVSRGDAATRRYVVDPWTFFTKALRLQPIPGLDVTTEGGERILMVHIDGDGFASRSEVPGTPFAGQVVHEQILNRYRLPTTVSVIEGETGATGMLPTDSPALEKLAQATFRLPFVEVASHSYSHPFDWHDAETGKMHNGKPAHLGIPGYRFDLRRDLLGSVEYIDKRLAPEGKKTKVFLWTGDCMPSGAAVAMTKGAGLYNMNGGGAQLLVDSPSLTQLNPTMLPHANGALQIYAPIENDNVFTNHWTGPYHGFRRVIETLRLTESPRRLTPLSVYYHYFSGTKPAGLKALVDIFDWALTQEPHPLYGSEYIQRVESFVNASSSRRLDGTWEFVGLGAVRTLRIDPQLGFPDLRRSKGVAGVRDLPVGRYATLASDRVEIAFSPDLPAQPYIERSNAEVLAFRVEPSGARIHLRGHVPIVFAVGGKKTACTLQLGKRTVHGVRSGAVSMFALPETDTGDALLACN